jgi:O-antigen ligase
MTSRSATVWRWLLAVAPCGVTLVSLTASTTPVAAKLAIAGVFIITLASPAEGLLLVAGLAPLGAFLGNLFDLGLFRLTEAVVVAFIAGWLIRPVPTAGERPHLPRYASAAGWLFAALVVGSIIAIGSVARAPGELRQTLTELASSYYVFRDRMGVIEGAKLLEGLALLAATIELFGRRPALAAELPVALGVSAVCAALTSALLWFGIGPDRVLAQHAMIGYRFSAHVPDVNAAGSHFALVLGLCLGMSARARRAAVRVAWLCASGAIVFGIWLSGSKAAIQGFAAAAALVVVWAVTRNWRGHARAGLLIALLTVAVAGIVLRARAIEYRYQGVQQRAEFTATSLRMMAARPIFGVGVGRYYQDSSLFFSPSLAWSFGSENAHNYFLQIGGETGVVGMALFIALLAGGLALAARALTDNPYDFRLLGATAGVVALLATSVTGHPLLVPEVAAAFWMQFGLMAALGSSQLLRRAESAPSTSAHRPPAWPVATAAGTILILVAVPWVARSAPVAPPASAAVDGFYGWETTGDGMRFRWTKEYASIFVPDDVTRMNIPVRVPETARPIGVEFSAAGTQIGRFVVRDAWSTIGVNLPPGRHGLFRINFKIDRVWQPALFIAGNSEMRSVGVQVGDIQFVR